MLVLLASLLLLLPLDPPFGEAAATAADVDDRLLLEVSVEVEGSPVAVVVRGVGSGNAELPPVALGNKGDGLWAGLVDLPVVENILLGFEIIPQQGPAIVSELNTLTDLGVDRAVFAMDDVPTGLGEESPLITNEGRRWGWLGVAAGAAALMLVALWAGDFLGGRRSEGAEDSGGPEQDGDRDDSDEADEILQSDPIAD
jgi:hypothetical protein